ncbi:MAG: hypothetical protein HY782_19010 [Chloroflexi bacterium]|nr:hypothetical protein [Chloroflexota bacterium]
MNVQPEFQVIFKRLKRILQRFETDLVVQANASGNYSLNTPFSDAYAKEVFFGAVQVRKNYVSYHLMPVYVFPDLLEDISPNLKKRMHGKSCFNFKVLDQETLEELERLTARGIERFRQGHLLQTPNSHAK